MTRTAIGGKSESRRELVAHAEGTLRPGPDRQLSVFPPGDGRSRLERRMGDVGDRISLLEMDVGGFPARRNRAGSRLAIAIVQSAPAPATLRLQVVVEILAGEPRTGVPLRP